MSESEKYCFFSELMSCALQGSPLTHVCALEKKQPYPKANAVQKNLNVRLILSGLYGLVAILFSIYSSSLFSLLLLDFFLVSLLVGSVQPYRSTFSCAHPSIPLTSKYSCQISFPPFFFLHVDFLQYLHTMPACFVGRFFFMRNIWYCYKFIYFWVYQWLQVVRYKDYNHYDEQEFQNSEDWFARNS